MSRIPTFRLKSISRYSTQMHYFTPMLIGFGLALLASTFTLVDAWIKISKCPEHPTLYFSHNDDDYTKYCQVPTKSLKKTSNESRIEWFVEGRRVPETDVHYPLFILTPQTVSLYLVFIAAAAFVIYVTLITFWWHQFIVLETEHGDLVSLSKGQDGIIRKVATAENEDLLLLDNQIHDWSCKFSKRELFQWKHWKKRRVHVHLTTDDVFDWIEKMKLDENGYRLLTKNCKHFAFEVFKHFTVDGPFTLPQAIPYQ